MSAFLPFDSHEGQRIIRGVQAAADGAAFRLVDADEDNGSGSDTD